MENWTSGSVCSLSGASFNEELTSSCLSLSSKYYNDSVWENAAYGYRRQSSIHQLYTRFTATRKSKPGTSLRQRKSTRQVWDLEQGGWESSEEDLSTLDDGMKAVSDADSLVSQALPVPSLIVTPEEQQHHLPHKVDLIDRQCSSGGESVIDSREGSGCSLEAQSCWSVDQSIDLQSPTVSVTLKRKVFEGGSSFGVSLLGGVRNRNGELQTLVTSVDERCHHEDGSGIKEGDLVTQWNDRKVTGMSFEAVCMLLLETEGESLNSERTEARVELIRSAEAKQTFQKISHTVEAEVARARKSPLLSNLKKEWIEQPGSIQVSIQHDCSSSSLTLGVVQAKLHPRPSPADQPEPEILVNVYLIPVPTSSEAHRSTKLVQASPNGDAVWRQTFQPYDLQLRQLMHTDLQVIVWEYSHDTEYKFLGEVNLLLSDTTLVDLKGQALWYPLGEHNPNLGPLPPPRLARPKRLSLLNRLQTRLKRHPGTNHLNRQVNETPKTSVPPKGAVSPSDEGTTQRRRKNSPNILLDRQVNETFKGAVSPSDEGTTQRRRKNSTNIFLDRQVYEASKSAVSPSDEGTTQRRRKNSPNILLDRQVNETSKSAVSPSDEGSTQRRRKNSPNIFLDRQVNETSKGAVLPSDDSTTQRRRKKSACRSANIPCILEELTASPAPSSVDVDSLSPVQPGSGCSAAGPVGVETQSGKGHLHDTMSQPAGSSYERMPSAGLSVSSDGVESSWCSVLEGSGAIDNGSLSRTCSSFALSHSGRLSESENVFESDDEHTDGSASPCLPAPRDRIGVAVTQITHLRRYRMFASTSSLTEVSTDENEQGLSGHRWTQSLSDLTEEDVACENPPLLERRRKRSLLSQVWRRFYFRTEDSQAIDSQCQLGPAQFVPPEDKSKQLNVVGTVELSFQRHSATVLTITFNQLAKTSKKAFNGECLVWIATYGDGDKMMSKQHVSLHFQHSSRSGRSVSVNTEQSTTAQLNMRCSSRRLSKPIAGQVWLSIAELASRSSTVEGGTYLLLKP